jgi:hypothetical protein
LAAQADRFVRSTPFAIDFVRKRERAKEQQKLTRAAPEMPRVGTRSRDGPEIER